ncbi:hypothetical protein J6590_033597 [Homalodisca vitripennis]|nr:hypothetical protein J6590_033597 [Homalodisca vitripennis]
MLTIVNEVEYESHYTEEFVPRKGVEKFPIGSSVEQLGASWCASGVRKRPLRLKCMAVGRPIEEEEGWSA